MLNVLNLTLDAVMLGLNVPTYMEATYWLDYYRKNYGHTAEFVLVRWDHETEAYYFIH